MEEIQKKTYSQQLESSKAIFQAGFAHQREKHIAFDHAVQTKAAESGRLLRVHSGT